MDATESKPQMRTEQEIRREIYNLAHAIALDIAQPARDRVAALNVMVDALCRDMWRG